MTTTRHEIASVDIGHHGQPGDSGCTEIVVKIFVIKSGFESIGVYRIGGNQGCFECHYSNGPWRGRGESPEAAVKAMLAIVDCEYAAPMRRAGQEAVYDADDAYDSDDDIVLGTKPKN
ncbi:MAG: hypothetical protein E4H01_10520 [Lysobacterales bacterium]|nr:MAG: hypothetical protein E4H01_10520 [Xanthomonadales bacterium]